VVGGLEQGRVHPNLAVDHLERWSLIPGIVHNPATCASKGRIISSIWTSTGRSSSPGRPRHPRGAPTPAPARALTGGHSTALNLDISEEAGWP
jgi:hypothetical protein